MTEDVRAEAAPPPPVPLPEPMLADVVILPREIDSEGRGLYDSSVVTVVKELRDEGVSASYQHDRDSRSWIGEYGLGAIVLSLIVGIGSNAGWRGICRLLQRQHGTDQVRVTIGRYRQTAEYTTWEWYELERTGMSRCGCARRASTATLVESTRWSRNWRGAVESDEPDSAPGTTPLKDGIPLDAPNAPEEGSDAGSDRDLRNDYRMSMIRGYRGQARRHLSKAKRLAGHSPRHAEDEARTAVDRAARAFWWAEDSDLEEAQHELMHQIGRWTRRTFGCRLHFDGRQYSHRCPIRIAHKRIGNSPGFVAQRICTLCGDDLSECPHRRGRSYWIRGGAWENGPCRVCQNDRCRHSPTKLYRVSVGAVIRHVEELREISLVRRPVQPEARLTALPVRTTHLRQVLGTAFRVGMPVSCDACIGQCAGIEEVELDDDRHLEVQSLRDHEPGKRVFGRTPRRR